MAKPKIWALVSNAVRARIIGGLDGDAEDHIELVRQAESTHLRDILSDKAGRSFTSNHGGRRSALEPGSDPILRDMHDFARETLDFLERHRRSGSFDQLVIVAAPKMLGVLREECPESLKPAIVAERAANLVQMPETELRRTMRLFLKELSKG